MDNNTQLLNKFTRFVSRDCACIPELTEELLTALIDAKILQTYVDIYKLKNHENEVIELLNDENLYDKLIKKIDKSRKMPLWKYLNALNIESFDKHTCKLIHLCFDGDYYAFIEGCLDRFNFTQYASCTPEQSANLMCWFKNPTDIECGLIEQMRFDRKVGCYELKGY